VEQGKTYLIRVVNAGTLDMESLCFVVRMLASTHICQPTPVLYQYSIDPATKFGVGPCRPCLTAGWHLSR
jgi:hypothetical protein